MSDESYSFVTDGGQAPDMADLTAERLRSWWADQVGELTEHGLDVANMDGLLLDVADLLHRALIERHDVLDSKVRLLAFMEAREGGPEGFDDLIRQLILETAAMTAACSSALRGSAKDLSPNVSMAQLNVRGRYMVQLGGPLAIIQALPAMVGPTPVDELVRPDSPTTRDMKEAQVRLVALHAAALAVVDALASGTEP